MAIYRHFSKVRPKLSSVKRQMSWLCGRREEVMNIIISGVYVQILKHNFYCIKIYLVMFATKLKSLMIKNQYAAHRFRVFISKFS